MTDNNTAHDPDGRAWERVAAALVILLAIVAVVRLLWSMDFSRGLPFTVGDFWTRPQPVALLLAAGIALALSASAQLVRHGLARTLFFAAYVAAAFYTLALVLRITTVLRLTGSIGPPGFF